MHAPRRLPTPVPALFFTLWALVLCAPAFPQAAPAADPELQALQGSWIVAAAESGGKPFDAIRGGRLRITSAAFDLVTASGNHLTGSIAINATANPKQLDFLLANGERWLAIYTVSDSSLRLNYVEDEGGATRPTQFVTSSDMRGTVIALRRSGS